MHKSQAANGTAVTSKVHHSVRHRRAREVSTRLAMLHLSKRNRAHHPNMHGVPPQQLRKNYIHQMTFLKRLPAGMAENTVVIGKSTPRRAYVESASGVPSDSTSTEWPMLHTWRLLRRRLRTSLSLLRMPRYIEDLWYDYSNSDTLRPYMMYPTEQSLGVKLKSRVDAASFLDDDWCSIFDHRSSSVVIIRAPGDIDHITKRLVQSHLENLFGMLCVVIEVVPVY